MTNYINNQISTQKMTMRFLKLGYPIYIYFDQNITQHMAIANKEHNINTHFCLLNDYKVI